MSSPLIFSKKKYFPSHQSKVIVSAGMNLWVAIILHHVLVIQKSILYILPILYIEKEHSPHPFTGGTQTSSAGNSHSIGFLPRGVATGSVASP